LELMGGRHDDFAINDRRVGADQECFVRDLLEPVGPIVAPAREHPDALIGDMKLDAVAIELDLMHPSLALGTRSINEANAGSTKPG
jgi:hypothetical protein